MSLLDNAPWIREHIELYKRDPVKAHDYTVPGQSEPTPALLLTTIGRKSGEKRDLPLIYGRDGDRFVIVASMGGAPEHPSWYKNLQANPRAEVQVANEHHVVRAYDAEGDERARLWALMAKIYPPYDEYAARAKDHREIPVVVLEPVNA